MSQLLVLFPIRPSVESTAVAKSVKVVSEALARHIFNLSSTGSFEIFTEGLV